MQRFLYHIFITMPFIVFAMLYRMITDRPVDNDTFKKK